MISIFNVLMHNITSRRLTGEARDALIELIMKNCKYTELNWAEMMLKTDAYQRLMEVASEMPEYKYESSMEVTDESRTIVGVTLGKTIANRRDAFFWMICRICLNYSA
jgi:hypothetical protein